MSTAPRVDLPRIADLQYFALTWYGQTVERLCASTGLASLRLTPALQGPLRELHGVATDHVVAASAELALGDVNLDDCVVVGGPCIGDCTRYPTLEALYDSLQSLYVGKALGAPVLLYLGDREETLETGSGAAKWGKLAARFEHWLGGLAKTIGWDQLTVVATSSDAHEAALTALRAPTARASGAELDSAFHIGSGSPREGNDSSRLGTRRVIEAHMPSVVGHHVADHGSTPRVIVAENVQQAPLFNLAKRYAPSGNMAYVGHWPAPSLSAEARMYRSDSWNKIPAWELESILTTAVPGLHPYTQQFFECWLDADLRGDVVAAARAW